MEGIKCPCDIQPYKPAIGLYPCRQCHRLICGNCGILITNGSGKMITIHKTCFRRNTDAYIRYLCGLNHTNSIDRIKSGKQCVYCNTLPYKKSPWMVVLGKKYAHVWCWKRIYGQFYINNMLYGEA